MSFPKSIYVPGVRTTLNIYYYRQRQTHDTNVIINLSVTVIEPVRSNTCGGRTVMAGVVERRAVLVIQERLHLSPADRLQ